MSEQSRDTNVEEFVIFKIGEEEYALYIKNVQEIVKLSDITKIPRSPHYLLGITNLRGNVLPVIDSRKRFSLRETKHADNLRMLVVDFKDTISGFLIDSVSEVLRIDARKVEKAGDVISEELKNSSIKNFIEGIIKEEDGKRIIFLLNLDSILKIETTRESNKFSLGREITTEESTGKKLEEEQIVVFKVANDEYGFSINAVREILRVKKLTKVPNTPPYVKGILTLRGKILPIFDFREMIGIASQEEEFLSAINIVEKNHKKWLKELERALYDYEHINNTHLDNICDIRPLKENRDNLELSTKENIEEFIELHEKIHLNTSKLLELAGRDMGEAQYYYETEINNREKLLEQKLKEISSEIIQATNNEKKILVIELNSTTVGLLVDKVSEVINIPKELIDFSINESQSEMELKGIVKIDDGRRLIFLIDGNLLFKESDKNLIRKLKGEESKALGDETMTENEKIEDTITHMERFVTFTIDNEEYGINIMQIQEINRVSKVTKVPRAPTFIEGVINLRGEVLPVIDIRKRFGIENKPIDERTRVIITDVSGKKTGLIVDKVNEVMGIPKTNIEPTPDIILSNARAEFLDGVGKVDEGKRMVLIINVNKILSAKEQNEFNTIDVSTVSAETNKTEKPDKSTKAVKSYKTQQNTNKDEQNIPKNKRRELKIEE